MDIRREIIGKNYMYFILVLWFSTEILFNSTLEYIFWWEIGAVNQLMAFLVLGLVFTQIVFFQHYSFRELVILIVISGPIILGTLNSGNNVMLSTWLLIISAKYIDFDDAMKLTYYVLLFFVPLVIYLYFAGIIDEKTAYRGMVVRHSLGFNHPNWLGIRVFQLVLSRAYLRRNKLNLVDYILDIIAIYFVYKVPNSQTAYILLVIFLIMKALYDIADLFQGGRLAFIKFLIGCAAFANVFSIFMSVIDIRKYYFFKRVDKLLSLRFSWCHRTMKAFGVSLFGKYIELYGRRMNTLYRKFYMDTAYVAILLRYGIIVFILFSVLYIVTMRYLLKTRNYFLIMILCLYAIYGIMENTFFSMTQNIFLLALAAPIFNKSLKDETSLVERGRTRIRIVF